MIKKVYKCNDGVILYSQPGRKGPGDKRYIILPNEIGKIYAPSLEFLGMLSRAWGHNEERLYPPPAKGRRFVADFLNDCVMDINTKLKDICKKYKIPNF